MPGGQGQNNQQSNANKQGNAQQGQTDAIARFTSIVGRPPTAFELKWANDPKVNGYYGGSMGGALDWQAERLGGVTNTISQMANAYGVTLDQAQINKIRDTYLPTGSSSDSDIAKAEQYFVAELTKLKDTQTANELQAKTDAAKNPTVTDAHISTAKQLVDSYGLGDISGINDFIAKELAGGASAFEMGQFLSTTPQYQAKQAEAERARIATEARAAREELGQNLTAQTQLAFQKAQPQIISQYMKAGKLNSSGVDTAVSQQLAKLQQQQNDYMANLAYQDAAAQAGYSRQDFLNQQGQGYNQYLRQSEPAYQQQFNVQNASNYAQYQSPWDAQNRQFQLSDARTARANELQDYYLQQADYNKQQSAARKAQREAALYGLAGSAIAGGAGAMTSYYANK